MYKLVYTALSSSSFAVELRRSSRALSARCLRRSASIEEGLLGGGSVGSGGVGVGVRGRMGRKIVNNMVDTTDMMGRTGSGKRVAKAKGSEESPLTEFLCWKNRR